MCYNEKRRRQRQENFAEEGIFWGYRGIFTRKPKGERHVTTTTKTDGGVTNGMPCSRWCCFGWLDWPRILSNKHKSRNRNGVPHNYHANFAH